MGIYDRDYGRDGYDDQGSRFGSDWSMTTWIMVVTVGLFAGQLFIPGLTSWMQLNEDWYTQPWQFYRLLTYGFTHDPVNLWHIIGNMLMLFIFGRGVESRYGSREMLAIYLVAIVSSGVVWNLAELPVANQVMTPAGPEIRIPVVYGASGAVSAILVLFALNYPKQELLFFGVLPIPAWAFAAILVFTDAYGAITRSGNVAYVAHLGGALFGYLYFRNNWRIASWLPAGFTFKRPKLRPTLKVHRGEGDEESATDFQLDRILAKIQASGQDSLTASERKILEQASKRYQQRNQQRRDS